MALSKTVKGAQDVVKCHLCEVETNIKCKCVDCELLMCDHCRHRVHPKFKNAKDHKIIDMKDLGQGERNLDFTNINCKQHNKQACSLFCCTCDHLVCPRCVAKPHARHQLLEIKEAYRMKVEKLKNGQRKMEKEKVQLMNENQKLESIQSNETTKQNKIKQDIQSQREALIKDINLYSDKLLVETDTEMNSIKDSVSKEKSKVTKILKAMNDQEKQAENIIHTTDTTKFFDVLDNLGKILDENIAPINLNHRRIPQFVPGEISQSNIGSLNEYTTSDKGLELRVTHSFTSNVKHIRYIAVSPDGSLWKGDSLADELQNIRLNGGSLRKITSLSIQYIRGIAVQSDNTVLFSDGSSTLKQISKRGKIIDSKYKLLDPLYIVAVHITTNQKLILGAISTVKAHPVTGRRVVIVMNHSGNQEKIYENDRHNRRILSYPHNITSTTNGNIFLVDHILGDDYKGRIVVLSPDGDKLNIYNGHPDINTQEKPFKPIDVVTTSSDNVLVTVTNASYIYILNNKGYHTTQINCGYHDIFYSCSMAFSTTGQLYIGTSPPRASKDKAKLFEVELHGC